MRWSLVDQWPHAQKLLLLFKGAFFLKYIWSDVFILQGHMETTIVHVASKVLFQFIGLEGLPLHKMT